MQGEWSTNNTQQWGASERGAGRGAPQNNNRAPVAYDGTSRSQFESGGQGGNFQQQPQANSYPTQSSPARREDDQLFQYAAQRSKQPQAAPQQQQQQQQQQQDFSFPGPTNKPRAIGNQNSVLRQQGQQFVKKAQVVRCKGRVGQGPRDQLDLNGQRDDNTKYFRKPQREYSAKQSNIDIAGSYTSPRVNNTALKQVTPPVLDTDIFNVRSNPPPVNYSLKPSANGYDKTSGIFQAGARAAPSRNMLANYRHKPTNDLIG